jgi:hypothetical protein
MVFNRNSIKCFCDGKINCEITNFFIRIYPMNVDSGLFANTIVFNNSFKSPGDFNLNFV